MSHNRALDLHVLDLLPHNLNKLVILDVGCGFGDWGFLIRTRKRGVPYLIGADIWLPYLKILKPLNIYDEVIRIEASRIPIKSKSVDITLACEILEHLPKKNGEILLKNIERITKKLIVLSTPLNCPQDELEGNPYQKHVTEWSLKELKNFGFQGRIVYTLPKTLRIIDRIRRLSLGLRPQPCLIVAKKRLG